MNDPRIVAAAKAIYGPGIWEQDQKSKNWNVGIDVGEARTLAALVIEAINEASTVTTAEDLAVLPNETIIRDIHGLALRKGVVGWSCDNGGHGLTDAEVAAEGLPARVLHYGGAK